jgi:hypothetical protein
VPDSGVSHAEQAIGDCVAACCGGALQMHLAQKVTAVRQARDHLGHDR